MKKNTLGHFDFAEYARRWPAPTVARSDEAFMAFAGGALPSARTMANIDSQGKGPRERFRVGRCVVYPVGSLVDWMKERSES